MSLLSDILVDLLNTGSVTPGNDVTQPLLSVTCSVIYDSQLALPEQLANFINLSSDPAAAGSYAAVVYGQDPIYSQGLLCRKDPSTQLWKWVVPYRFVTRFLVQGGTMKAYLDPVQTAVVPEGAIVFKEGIVQSPVPTIIPAGTGNWGVVVYNTIYTLPEASDTVLGGITVPATSGLSITAGALSVDPTTISSKLPVASDTVTGIIQLATAAEITAGTNATHAVTPVQLVTAVTSISVPLASTTVAGKIEIATDADVTAGADTGKAVTPAQLKSQITSIDVPLASTTVAGKIQIATDAEVTTGADTTKAVTPAQLKAGITSVDVPVASTTVQGKVQLATPAEAAARTDAGKAITSVGLAPFALTTEVTVDVAAAVAHLSNRVYADTLWTAKAGPATVPGNVEFFTTTIPAHTVKPGGRLVISYVVDDPVNASVQNADGSNKFSTVNRGVTLTVGGQLLIGGTGGNVAVDPNPPVSGVYVWGIGTTAANYSAPTSVPATYIKQITTCTIWVDSTGAARMYVSGEGIGNTGEQGTVQSSPNTVPLTMDFTVDQVVLIEGQYGATADQIFIGNVEVVVTN